VKPAPSSQTAAALAREFDASFARAAELEPSGGEQLIAIGAGNLSLAVRTREIAAVMRCPPLAAVPGRNPALCGLAGVRGSVVAVYAIAALVGDSGAGPAAGGWIALCAADRSAALLFDTLDGYARLPKLFESEIAELVRIDGASRAVIRIAELLETIGRSANRRTQGVD
jgi:chemotaxis signal transduction protein